MTRKNFNELRKRMTPRRRARNKAAARGVMAEMALSELRKAAGLTQVELAGVLGVSQANLSKLENQDDMQVSTLARLVRAMGGRLDFLVTTPAGTVRISQFSETVEPRG